MSVLNKLGGYGQVVVGAAKNLPQTAAGNIFTITGGPILLTGLFGIVTSALGATATTLSVGSTGGTSSGVSLATAVAVTSSPVGTVLAVPSPAGGALVVSATGGVGLSTGKPQDAGGLAVVTAGSLTVTTNANDTGQVQWYLMYIPFPGTAVVAV